MTQELTTRRENVGLTVMSYFILVAAGVVGLRFNPPASATVRWAVIILLAAIAVVQARPPRAGGPRWMIHAYLGIYGVLVAALMFLQPGWTMYPILYTTPIAFAILALPAPQGLYWAAAFTVVTATSFAVGFNLVEGLIALFLYAVIYAFIGTFAVVLARADAARRESQALLTKLQAAHGQLQQYAMRVEELAAVEERNRLAREMHDTLGHRLTVAAVQLEAAQRLCSSDPERSAAMVGTAREQVREALAELRTTVAALRAPIEADLHLSTSLRRLSAQFEQATGLTVHQVLPDELPPLPYGYRLALYRTAQEALTNVQRHAQASQVWLVLSATDTAVSLLVSDDGQGITLSREQVGFGLRGLGERAAELGGDLHLEARRGGGTQLTFRLPLPAPAASEASGNLQGLGEGTDVRTDPNPIGG
jgi:signal transduction histidine kinase